MTAVKYQLRGTCQSCGNEQACTRGTIANHGYSVEFGFFQGSCSGSGRLPMNDSTDYTDLIIKKCGVAVKENNEILKLISNDSADYTFSVRKTKTTSVQVKWSEAKQSQKDNHRHLIENTIYRMENHAIFLTTLKSTVFGTELAKVAKEEPAEYIYTGDKRLMVNPAGVEYTLICKRNEGRRIYYTFDGSKSSNSWMAPSAWRKLQKV